ncbi:MAG: hypothetical protein H0V29_13495 [Thermoleophilaceae bacterium]|nr:hypothetical protein [Thermoleophilaceae bacterium]
MTPRLPLPNGHKLLALDLVVIAWVACWAVLGLTVAGEVRGIAELSRTVTKVGTAVEESGRTLGELGAVPLVGSQVDDSAKRIEGAGRSVIASGRASRESVRDLSLLLGLAIGLIPSLAPLAFYIPARVAYARECRAVQQLIDELGPGAEALLASRAMSSLPYRMLAAHGGDPLTALREHSYSELARAELARYGLDPSALDPDGKARQRR